VKTNTINYKLHILELIQKNIKWILHISIIRVLYTISIDCSVELVQGVSIHSFRYNLWNEAVYMTVLTIRHLRVGVYLIHY